MAQLQDNGNANQSTQQTSSGRKIQKNELWGEGPMRIRVEYDGQAAVTLGPFRISDIYINEETLKNCVDYETVRMMINICVALSATQETLKQNEQVPNYDKIAEQHREADATLKHYDNSKLQQEHRKSIKDELSDYDN